MRPWYLELGVSVVWVYDRFAHRLLEGCTNAVGVLMLRYSPHEVGIVGSSCVRLDTVEILGVEIAVRELGYD